MARRTLLIVLFSMIAAYAAFSDSTGSLIVIEEYDHVTVQKHDVSFVKAAAVSSEGTIIRDGPLLASEYTIFIPFARIKHASGEFLHLGVDLHAPSNTGVVAIGDGSVHDKGYDKVGLGNYFVIEHVDGLYSYYGHLSHMFVKPGDVVTAGQLIGKVGNTGLAFIPCIHFALRKNDTYYNPIIWFFTQLKIGGLSVR